MAGLPPQLVADQRGVDWVAAVMAGVAAHQGDKERVRSPLGTELIYQGEDRPCHLAVIAFPTASCAVGDAESPARLVSDPREAHLRRERSRC